ncbi:MAG: 2-oxoacid:acceptor oxidoreductase family protein [Dehalococcoidales bacterium]|nr:2-oxoacid:acceptor oxidoreductase family protein [Dehalococcoidales bacterium]
MKREELVLGGFGGQGIILAGNIAAQAAAIYDKQNATLTQDYGPEARGGSCRAQVVISDELISYPYIDSPDVLVVMSQEAYTKYTPELRKNGLLLIDEDLVKPGKSNRKMFVVPATRIAQELGRVAVANIVMLGFLTAVTRLVSLEAMKKSVLQSVPKGTEELNTKAFERGYACGLEKVGGGDRRK